MICGIGTDLVDARRIERVHARRGAAFAQRILHPQELDAWEARGRLSTDLAKAWAAKEAIAKALGTGFVGLAYADVGYVRDARGAPQCVLSERGRARVAAVGGHIVHVSLSDEPPYVLAFAVISAIGSSAT